MSVPSSTHSPKTPVAGTQISSSKPTALAESIKLTERVLKASEERIKFYEEALKNFK